MRFADVAVIGGGQAGLATAQVARSRGLVPVVLDASPGPGGSWPRYYDSLTLFSPAGFSSLPGLPFPGDPDRYPSRDEVVDYLAGYARWLDADVRFGRRVDQVTRWLVPAFAGLSLSDAWSVARTGL
jgi:putative flavoprotein involved in K+ transport